MLVYCISPNYLGFLMNEFKMLDTVMQGYGNFKDASANLLFVNKSEMLGVIIVARSIDVKDKDFLMFMKKLNLTGSTKVVIALDSMENINAIAKIKNKFSDLELFGLAPYTMTDLLVRRELLGTLLTSYDEYSLHSDPLTKVEAVLNKGRLGCSSLIKKDIELCCEGGYNLNLTVDEALERDLNLSRINSDVFRKLRELKIRYMLGEVSSEYFREMKSMCENVKKPDKWMALSILAELEEAYYNGRVVR